MNSRCCRPVPGWPRTFAVVLFCGLVLPGRAHRVDEILQAALVSIEPDAVRLEVSLTPGIESLPDLLAVLDPDQDGQISTLEEATYASRLRSELHLNLDGHALALRETGHQFPPLEELRNGAGVLRFQIQAKIPSLTAGRHELNYQNRHLSERSAYLVNAVLPQSPALQVTGQFRNTNQSESRIAFIRTSVLPADFEVPSTRPRWIGLLLGVAGGGAALVAIWRRREKPDAAPPHPIRGR